MNKRDIIHPSIADIPSEPRGPLTIDEINQSNQDSAEFQAKLDTGIAQIQAERDAKRALVTTARDERGRLLPGQVLNPGGGPTAKRVQAFQRMLNQEHRNLEASRELFARLRRLAMGDIELIPVATADGVITVKAEIKADAAFMKMYLDRVWGPAKEFDSNMDLRDAPIEVLEYLRMKVSR